MWPFSPEVADAAAILLDCVVRKTGSGVHNFVLGLGNPDRYALSMASGASAAGLKTTVADFWNAEPCGSRYLNHADFAAHARERYSLEPFIPDFAGFRSSGGKRVLEIGVGMGADYEQWLRAGAIATGVDVSWQSLARARQRCEQAGLKHDLQCADAERLPFGADSFDIVYSYGVMHHSPDTARCVSEAWRVLKPGGTAKIMLYHHPSMTGLMLWLRFGILKFQTIRRCVYQNLESPGTKTFTIAEVRAMFKEFDNVRIEQVFSPGDLLLNEPSAKFQGRGYKAIWKLFPRRLVRLLGQRWGLFLLITAKKAEKPRI